MILAQIIVWILAFAYVATGKALAPIMVTIGMLLDWPRICWPWDNIKNRGRYADGWWYQEDHWTWTISDFAAEWWWRAIRNGFSNGARYTLKNAENVWRHPDYHYGFYKGPKERAFPDGPPYPKTLFRYEYDRDRWYLARYVFTWFVSESRYFQFYAGFKFDRTDGFGFSVRCWLYRNEK